MLEDIAILTGGKCITEDLGLKLESLTLSDLGKCKRIVVDKDNTTIIGLTAIGRATIDALQMNRPQLLRVRRMWVKMGEHPPQRADKQ